jgi:hypothetical protein
MKTPSDVTDVKSGIGETLFIDHQRNYSITENPFGKKGGQPCRK